MRVTVQPWRLDLGASVEDGEKTTFRVWAPKAQGVTVRFRNSQTIREQGLEREDRGYFAGTVEGVQAGDRYTYVLDGSIERPDPASRFQPDGVHGPSMIVDPASFVWTDEGWRGDDLSRYVIYELHVGAFSDAGTFDGVVSRLGYLRDLGVTALELMPVGQFPGARNWGYDGVYPFAPQNSYGGFTGLKRLVDRTHSMGLSVILDVVYNHLGPEGNYLGDFGHYFTDRYKTPWGSAINFDGPYSDEVRAYFIKNACYWVSEFHIDALRLDAIHGIFDFSARHLLLELSQAVHGLGEQLGRKVSLIAESDLDDVRVITSPFLGGYGIDAQWNDDFHHSLHTLLTGERRGYYEDFGGTEKLAKALTEGFVYSGEYSVYRKRRHGSSSRGRSAHRFVHFSQNHDQVGNRPNGERPNGAGNVERLKLAAATVLFTPGIPLLFMGEEYGETAPFPYFIDYHDPVLTEAVRKGRAGEFAMLGWPGENVADPSTEATFLQAKIDHGLRFQPGHETIFAFYREALRLRRTAAVFRKPTRRGLTVRVPEGSRVIVMTREQKGEAWLLLFNFSALPFAVSSALISGRWDKTLDSASILWGGPGEKAPLVIDGLQGDIDLPGHSAVLYRARLKRR